MRVRKMLQNDSYIIRSRQLIIRGEFLRGKTVCCTEALNNMLGMHNVNCDDEQILFT